MRQQASCRSCGSEFFFYQSNSRGIYCSNRCQFDYQHKQRVSQWLDGASSVFDPATGSLNDWLRKHLIEQAGKKCSECGWDAINPTLGTSPLEVDHIDGDYTNNRPENLRVLCPNCHALKPTYKALNCGNGRAMRRSKQTTDA